MTDIIKRRVASARPQKRERIIRIMIQATKLQTVPIFFRFMLNYPFFAFSNVIHKPRFVFQIQNLQPGKNLVGQAKNWHNKSGIL